MGTLLGDIRGGERIRRGIRDRDFDKEYADRSGYFKNKDFQTCISMKI
jgi:hypothetical protein